MMRPNRHWLTAAAILGLAFASLPHLSLRWFLLYPYPLIPTFFWLEFADRLGMLGTSCLAFLVGPLLFALASPSLFRGAPKISRKDVWVLIVFSLLEVADLVASWKDGYKYFPGPTWTNLTILVSLFWLAIVWLFFQRAKKDRTYLSTLLYHFVFVLWLVVYAFPWFGEMI